MVKSTPSPSPSTRARRCAIYVRVSTTKQEEEGSSLGTQEAACRADAAAHGESVDESHVYRETYSGAELWDRPALTRLRDAIRERTIDGVVCYAIDRLSRDPVHLGIILSDAERFGVPVRFVTEPLDDTPEGQLIRFIKGYVGRVEREKTRERTLRGKHARVASGKVHNHGSDLFGYRRDKDDGVRLVHEEEARIVRRIFASVAEGSSIKATIKSLNDDGVPPPSAGKLVYRDGRAARWGNGAVHRIVRDATYTGETVEWRHQREGNRGGYVMRPESEWVRLPNGVTPAIIAPDLWRAVQDRLDSNLAAADARNAARPYLLRGLIACGVCGRPMRTSPEHGRRVYRCSSRETPAGACGGSRVPADLVEAWTWERVEAVLRRPEIIAAEVERQRSAGPDATLAADHAATARLLAKLDAQQARLVRRLADVDADFPTDLLEREIARLEGERRSARSNLAEVEARIAGHEAATVRLDGLHDYCDRVAAHLAGGLDFATRRDAVEALVERVVANGRDTAAWRLDGSIPVTDAGTLSSSSGRCAIPRRRLRAPASRAPVPGSRRNPPGPQTPDRACPPRPRTARSARRRSND